DWHVSHYAKVVLDEVFGAAACLNEIIWKRHNARSAAPRVWPRLHDTLLVYAKGRGAVFHPQRVPADVAKLPHTLITGADGRKYQTFELTAPGVTHGGESGRPWRGFDPSRWDRHWSVSHEQLDAWDAAGLIHWPARGGFPRRRAAAAFVPGERQVTVGDLWTDIDRINQAAEERWGYPTQKPEKLLERIIEASSDPGDLILDCFAGAGTTAVVAERLGRRWIAADRGRLAVHTTRKRLHTLTELRPFVLQVPGERERRLWSAAGVPQDSDPEARTLAHRRLVLACYGAEPLAVEPAQGEPRVHGYKKDRLVHVGPAHRPFERDDVGLVLAAAVRARDTVSRGTALSGVDILAWEFPFALDAEVLRLAATAGVQLLLRRIPPELLDLDAIDRPRITEYDFAPLRELTLRMTQQSRRVAVTLTDFILPAAALPPEAQARIGPVAHWSQWIDYWAVDWEHEEPLFRNAWRAFRRRGASDLPLVVEHEYPRPGSYLVAIKVIDLLGQETVRTLPLHLR
ncbi:MAG TPA: site-specific DNA-methyltransferase, partial [Polyangia bacterium]|nr:site-specific DNA-methyltransferase [Polyangia bacterium]